MTINATRTHTARKTNRTIRLDRAPTDDRPGKVTITQDGETTAYLITRLDSEIGGIAYQFDKIETATTTDGTKILKMEKRYNLLLDGDQSSCDCDWGIYGAHKKHCRHISGMLKLHAEGKLS
jgi:hypothetical protein